MGPSSSLKVVHTTVFIIRTTTTIILSLLLFGWVVSIDSFLVKNIRFHRQHLYPLVLDSNIPKTGRRITSLLYEQQLYDKDSDIGFEDNDDDDDDDDGGIGVGIDLGTTNSAIAYLNDNNQPQIIEIPQNGQTMPSIVVWTHTAKEVDIDDDNNNNNIIFKDAIVGKEALEWEQQQQQQQHNNDHHPTSAYRHVKRIMGTSAQFLSDDTKRVVPHLVQKEYSSNHMKSKLRKTIPKSPSLERLVQAARNDPTMLYPLPTSSSSSSSFDNVSNSSLLVSPEIISSCIVHKLITVAEQHTGRRVTRAVIGVPAYFNDAQREATVRAARACGLNKVKLLREPEAAALAYGVIDNNNNNQQTNSKEVIQEHEDSELVLVFDLGGGTYDVSVLLVERGLTEIICTAGNSQLGGTNFDAQIARYLLQQIQLGGTKAASDELFLMDKVVRSAECIRIYLSNHKVAQLVLPTTEKGWLELEDPRQVIVMAPKTKLSRTGDDLAATAGANDVLENVDGKNATHIFMSLTRRDMEQLCSNEFQELLRPIREVAIMAGALLPGDARPGATESSLEIEAALTDASNFYDDDDDIEDDENDKMEDDNYMSKDIQNALVAAEAELNLKSAKKLQQKGRKKAREVAKQERKYRAESRKVQDKQPDVKVMADGISGRPLSRIVLVGGATRMPAIGRIISSLTGVVPQRTVDPDLAVALGCAVHVGVLDGKEEMGVVLNPMQAALLRAVVEKERRQKGKVDDFPVDDNEDFAEIEYL